MPNGESGPLIRLIERRYAATGVSLHLLASGGKDVYRVRRTGGPDWVLRAYRPSDVGAEADDPAGALASILLLLQSLDYPAERVVHDFEGSAAVSHEGRRLLLTTSVGEPLRAWEPTVVSPTAAKTTNTRSPFDYTPKTLEAFGAALGRLHSLPLTGGNQLPPAGMLPRPELAWASECLASVDGRVPQQLRADYQRLVRAIQDTDYCEDLPQSIIHNDCNLGNAVHTPAGKIILIDWEGAGRGPAVVDVGFLLSSCFSRRDGRVHTRALHAVVDGYCRHRSLSAAEIGRLRDAVGFRALVLLACCFKRRVDHAPADEQLYGASYAQWQAQYEATDEIAALAAERFGRFP